MSARADPGGTRGTDSSARSYSRSRTEPAVEDRSPASRADEGPTRRREFEPAGVHKAAEAGTVCTTCRRAETDSEKHQGELHSLRSPLLVSVSAKKKGKGSPHLIAERRVPELIPVLGSQPAGDVSHKPGGRLTLLSARPAVTLAILKRAATSFTAW